MRQAQYEMLPRSSQDQYDGKAAARPLSDEYARPRPRREGVWCALVLAGTVLVTFLIYVALIHPRPAHAGRVAAAPSSCGAQSLRREWRTLTLDERSDYIEAVRCMATVPSRVLENATAYDDFPYVHALKSKLHEIEHMMPLFLPFHRYLLHVYESMLQKECGYKGVLPYWDWTLDWTDMPNSPVFDPDTGFGGDGDPDGEVVLDHGRCVTDGPFAKLRPLYRQTEYQPHCLARGFRRGAKTGNLFPGNDIRPQKVDAIIAEESYDGFNSALEMGPHNIIPFSIRGDFFSFSSPYEPLFFLHHAQLDRLWWIWQQRGPRRTMAYGVNGTLDDEMDMHGLSRNVRIREVMSTTSDLLCYRYF